MSAAPKSPVRAPEWHPALPDAEECRRRVDRLPPRQRQVVGMVAHGWTPKQVANQLGVTLHTIHKYLDAASAALDVRPPQPAVVALYHRAMTVESVEAPTPIRRASTIPRRWLTRAS